MAYFDFSLQDSDLDLFDFLTTVPNSNTFEDSGAISWNVVDSIETPLGFGMSIITYFIDEITYTSTFGDEIIWTGNFMADQEIGFGTGDLFFFGTGKSYEFTNANSLTSLNDIVADDLNVFINGSIGITGVGLFSDPVGVLADMFAGEDVFDLRAIAAPDALVNLVGDGRDVADQQSATAAGDLFEGDSDGLININSRIIGDFRNVYVGGEGFGARDVFHISAATIIGDVSVVAGRAIGGDDVFTAAALTPSDATPGTVPSPVAPKIIGDFEFILGQGFGGDDTFDYSASDVSGLAGAGPVILIGDVGTVSNNAVAVGGHDQITGSDSDDTIIGDFEIVRDGAFASGGNDRLLQGETTPGATTTMIGDADIVEGGGVLQGGNDVILGGLANDIIYGDVRMVDGTVIGGNDILRGFAGFDTIYGGGGNDFITGEYNADNLYGEDGDDVLNGGDGNDRHFGGNGNDRILAGQGNDVSYGQAGDDTIFGFGGFDVLDGGTGDDTLIGAFNWDRYVFKDNFGNDTILDFEADNPFERLDFSRHTGVSGMNDLTIEVVAGAVVISDGADNSVTLANVSDLSSITAADFIF
ncbi:MAG: calcium-binding protein [Pseudomonadota bacterium]